MAILWPPDAVEAILEGKDPEPALLEAARRSPCDAQLWRDRVAFAKALVWCSAPKRLNTAEGRIVQPYLAELRKQYPRCAERADFERRVRLNDPAQSSPWDRICDNSYKYNE